MKTITLRHPFEAKDRPHIYATMLDFRRFGEVHPLLKEVTLVGQPSHGVTSYFVKEEVMIGGWLRMKPQYTVHATEPAPGELIAYQARVMGIMKLRIQISFTLPDEIDKVELLEQVEVSRIPLITGMFLKVFTKAHHHAFDNLRKKLAESKALTASI